jgi:glycosyltransferase involved in cell wall biosynthesis
MKFSLVLATVGRTDELLRFLDSLQSQTFRDIELIIIDQNPDDRLIPVLSSFSNQFTILHIRSEKGLSRARNFGLKHITGDIIAFPDDDCWYPPDLLERVHNWFNNNPDIDGLTGRSIDENGRESISRWAKQSGKISKYGVWIRATSFTIFLRRPVVDRTGGFDEELGVGAGTPWGSAEEIDFLIRALNHRFYLYYNSDITVHHPNPVREYNTKSKERAYSYGRGMGKVLKIFGYPFWFLGYVFIRPLFGTVISILIINFPKAKHHWAILSGRVRGWFD